jgi:hypothetical protein
MHWKEIAVWQDIPLEPHWEGYYALEKSGNMVVYTVRDDQNNNKLVGYAVFFLRNHIHYKSHIWAANHLVWVHPDYRRRKKSAETLLISGKRLTIARRARCACRR